MNRTYETPGAWSRRGEVWLVDWRGSQAAQRLLRVAMHSGRSRAKVAILHAPGGGVHVARTALAGVPVLTPADVLGPDELRSIDDLVLSITRPLARGDSDDRGTRLARFNLLDLQDALRRFLVLSASLQAVCLANGIRNAKILSADLAMMQGLCRDALQYGVAGRSSRWMSTILRLGRWRRSAAPDRLVSRSGAAPVPSGPIRALLVSWTKPMDEMFQLVAGALQQRRDGTDLHLHHGVASVDRGAYLSPLAPQVVSMLQSPLELAGVVRALGDLTDGSRVVIRSALQSAHQRHGSQLEHKAFAERFLQRTPPRVVVVGNDRWWVGLAWVEAARARGIPTVCVQDGIAADMPQWRWSTADHIATNGRYLRDLLRTEGLREEQITVTGQPRYDVLVRGQPGGDRSDPVLAGLPPEKRYLLFATQYGQDPAFVRAVVEILLDVPAFHLLLRPHPSENSAIHHALADSATSRLTLVESQSVVDLVRVAEVLVVQSSSVAFEADVLGRRVVLADFTSQEVPDSLRYVRAEVCRDLTALRSAVEALAAQGPFPARELPDEPTVIGPLDGRSAERVAQLVRAVETRRGGL